MMDFLKRLFGGGVSKSGAPASSSTKSKKAKPPLPEEKVKEFTDWYFAQRKPAIELSPDPWVEIDPRGSRLLGPAWLPEGEVWPVDANGVPLEFIAQLNFADCQSLDGYPEEGLVQFFIGRDDLYGANFDDLLAGNYLVRYLAVDAPGALHSPPPLEPVGDQSFSEFSPSQIEEIRAGGIALAAEPVEDQLDLSIKEAGNRFAAIPKEYDLDPLYDLLEKEENMRPLRHHTGGYPAYTQSDIREDARYADYDHVLLRLTSDDFLMWGDVGECVFMIRSEDLAKGDFSRVAYSWDCH